MGKLKLQCYEAELCNKMQQFFTERALAHYLFEKTTVADYISVEVFTVANLVHAFNTIDNFRLYTKIVANEEDVKDEHIFSLFREAIKFLYNKSIHDLLVEGKNIFIENETKKSERE